MTDIQHNLSLNNYIPALFIDIEGAYDTVNLRTLREKMIKNFGIPDQLANTLTNIFRGRRIFIRDQHNLLIGPRLNYQGLPQGSVLSPILFNMYTADFSNCITDPSVGIIQYADDFCLYVGHKCRNTALSKLEDTTSRAFKWFNNNNLYVSKEKSAISIFTRHRITETENICLNDINFTYKKIIKYLGLLLDEKLTWKPHIDHIIERVNKSLNFLRMTTKTWWGTDITTALLFYRAYTRSIIDYGCTLYASASETTLRKLDILQNAALRICLGAMRSTPIEPLHAEALEPSLTLRRQFFAEKHIIRIKVFCEPLLMKISALNLDDLTSKYWEKKKSPLLCSAFRSYSHILATISTPSNVLTAEDYFALHTVSINSIIPEYSELPYLNNKIITATFHQFNNPYSIYTDASKTISGCGCAFFCPIDNIQKSFRLSNEHTIFTAEAFAIMKAVEYFLENCSSTVGVICSDSLSVIRSLENISPNYYRCNTYILKIRKLVWISHQNNKKIFFLYTKAHCGIWGNETVDTLAKQAYIDGEASRVKLSWRDSINLTKKKLVDNWKHKWETFAEHRSTRYAYLHPQLPSELWHKRKHIPRKYITSVIRMKFGHACYPAHLFKINILNSDKCDLCEVVGDLDHIFFACQKYTQATENFMKNLKKCNLQPPYNVLSLLACDKEDVLNALVGFLCESKVCL